MDIQDRGQNYKCYKCELNFGTQRELNLHLTHHMQQSTKDVENHTCHYCNLVFLDMCSLTKHCNEQGHDWRKKKKLIQIDATRTISIMKLSEDGITTNACDSSYREHIMEMKTVALRRQNAYSHERYKANIRIGKIEFQEPWKANCVGIL